MRSVSDASGLLVAAPRRRPLVQQLVAQSCRQELIPLLNLIHTVTDGTQLNLGVKQAFRRPVKRPGLQKPALVLSRFLCIVHESDLVVMERPLLLQTSASTVLLAVELPAAALAAF